MTGKQERFVQEYLLDLNGAAAARRAGYSVKSAAGTAVRLLAQEDVKLAVSHAMEERAEKCSIRQENVLKELGNIAFGQASDASGAAVKLGSKLRALELLGKHLGMFEGVGAMEDAGVQIVEDI